MKISIDARGINLYKGSGIGTYTENLLREILNIDTKIIIPFFGLGKITKIIKKIIQKLFSHQKSMVLFMKITTTQTILKKTT